MVTFMKNKSIKGWFSSPVSIILVVLIIIALISAVILIKPKDYKQIENSEFVIGKINDEGNFVKSDDYLCTENLIACDGLTIKPKFNAKTSYQIYFYNNKENFLYSTNVLNSKYEFVDSLPFVEYCRILIIPDRGNSTADEFSITLLNKSKYLNDFEITVYKEQKFEKFDYVTLNSNDLNQNKALTYGKNSSVELVDLNGYGVSERIDLSGAEEVYFLTNKNLNVTNGPNYCGFIITNNKISGFKYPDNFTRQNSYYVYHFNLKGLIATYGSADSIIVTCALDSNSQIYIKKA